MGLFGRIKKDIQVIFERDPRQRALRRLSSVTRVFMPSSCIELPTGSIKGDGVNTQDDFSIQQVSNRD